MACCTTTLVPIAGGRKGYAIIKRIVCAKGRDSEDPKVLHFSRHVNFTFLFVDWENSRKERDTFPAEMCEFSIARRVEPAHFLEWTFEEDLFQFFLMLWNFEKSIVANLQLRFEYFSWFDHFVVSEFINLNFEIFGIVYSHSRETFQECTNIFQNIFFQSTTRKEHIPVPFQLWDMKTFSRSFRVAANNNLDNVRTDDPLIVHILLYKKIYFRNSFWKFVVKHENF